MEDMSLLEGLEAANKCLDLFFENKFDHAKDYALPHAKESMFHAYGLALSTSAAAIFTMEKPQVDEAITNCKNATDACQRHRKKSSLINWIRAVDYESYTEMEAHAEACYADLHLATMLVQFVGDQSLLGMVKLVNLFFTCNSSYKTCEQIRDHKSIWSSDLIKRHFDCGVFMGYGLLILLFSHLPTRVTKLMSIVGISANRELGQKYLHNATDDIEMRDIFRASCSQFAILLYSCYLEQLFGVGHADMEWLKRAIAETSRKYPKSFLSLYFAGRVEQMKGNTFEAIELFERSIGTQSELKSLHNVSRWDMLWSYALDCNWAKAAECAKILQEECVWSPATNAYQYACFTYMIMDEENRPELQKVVDESMAAVIKLRRRYIGKTLPPEKFAVVMARRYLDGEKTLILPAFVLFYMWNIFGNSAEHPEVLKPILDRILRKKKTLTNGDNYYVLTLLEGVCYRNLTNFKEAKNCFLEIINLKKDECTENFVPPHAAMELGLTYMADGEYDNAKTWLTRARDDYTGFLVEAMVHLRIHGALDKLKSQTTRSEKFSLTS